MESVKNPTAEKNGIPTPGVRHSWSRSILLILVSCLAGCAADSGIVENLLIVPGSFDVMDCPALIARYRLESARVARFTMLMERSASEPAGPIVNAVAYNTDYAKARANQSASERAARAKGCDFTMSVPEPNLEAAEANQPSRSGRGSLSIPSR
jgi:hypothetical protein